jgi:hypothetical protein
MSVACNESLYLPVSARGPRASTFSNIHLSNVYGGSFRHRNCTGNIHIFERITVAATVATVRSETNSEVGTTLPSGFSGRSEIGYRTCCW